MDLDLRSLRYFVAVADELHFGRAAARLYISQPALSKQIRRLEDQLGFTLLERDSRHVTLTRHGRKVLVDAQDLLVLAERICRPPVDTDLVRIAHIFELQTSRVVADAFSARHPQVRLVETSLDSIRQLDALLDNRLDVAILRVTAAMVAQRPTGWSHRPLRLEPMYLVDRPGADVDSGTASLHDRRLDAFGDPPGSGLFNAHGQYLRAFEAHTDLTLHWLGNPGTFGNCLAAWRRAPAGGYLFEFSSYATRYADAGIAIHRPADIQPYYPWSIAWRDEPNTRAVRDFLATAERTADELSWRIPLPDHARPWVPADDQESTGPGFALG
ncbi:LysR family transcriptional regulator [Nocardia sp. NPDC005825]|uniref:LysR family transcriptional regulator n=1 Tax=unclassified Nocardia TaxID=2637762 RepID=UPI0033EE8146